VSRHRNCCGTCEPGYQPSPRARAFPQLKASQHLSKTLPALAKPFAVSASASSTNAGNTTFRFLLDLSEPTAKFPPTFTALVCKVIRCRRKSTSACDSFPVLHGIEGMLFLNFGQEGQET